MPPELLNPEIPAILTCCVHGGLFQSGETCYQRIMKNLLITGFTPFDGRDRNASWIAACSVDIPALEIPVVWGQPWDLLKAACEKDCPEIIVSLGEGRTGWFDIETRARAVRKERVDNNGDLPASPTLFNDVPSRREASIDAGFLQRGLSAYGYPVRISTDAGQFLCEETLYVLETLKDAFDTLHRVVFCHVPPYGTELYHSGKAVPCDPPLLADFARRLVSLCISESDRYPARHA